MPSIQARLMKAGGIQLVHAASRRGSGRAPTLDDVTAMRERFENMASRARMAADVEITQMDFGGVPGERLTTSQSSAGRAVLWLHGGAYILCSPVTHRGMTQMAARRAQATAYVPDYRLAPEHPHPAAFEDALTAWNFLTASYEPDRIAIMGDSAGGGLAAQLAVALRDAGRPMPGCMVLLSPWLDLSGSGPTMWERNERDPWLPAEHMHLAAEAYAGDLPLDDPAISPLFAELHGLPPTLIHVGTDEIIHDDGVRFARKAREVGVEASVGIWEGMFHVFQAFPLPEARRAWKEIGGFVQRHIPAR